MNKYVVIKFFTDLQDKHHPYHVGDSFPREGLRVTQKRLDELSGSNNKRHKPLIEKAEVPDPEPITPMTSTVPKKSEQTEPRRGRKKNDFDRTLS